MTSQARFELGIFRGKKQRHFVLDLHVNLGYDNLTIQLLLFKSAAVTVLKCTLFFPSAFLTQHRVFKRVQTE